MSTNIELFNPIALIDADSLYYRPCAAITRDKDKLSNKMKRDIKVAILKTIGDIQKDTKCGDMYIAVKGNGNFRKDIFPSYKGTRPDLPQVMKDALNFAHQHMLDDYSAVPAHGMEADDLCSIWAHEAMGSNRQHVVCGIDKDLLQIPGWHYNFVKRDLMFMDPDAAHLHLMHQCLTGDRTDNIPGIKGIGPKKAERLLDGVPLKRRWNRVRAAWRAHRAGDPVSSWRLLAMLKTWEEFNDLTGVTPEGEAPVSQQDDGKEQNLQDTGV